MGSKTYTNKARIVPSGGPHKGQVFGVGEYEGDLAHLNEGQIALLLKKRVIVEVVAPKPPSKIKEAPSG